MGKRSRSRSNRAAHGKREAAADVVAGTSGGAAGIAGGMLLPPLGALIGPAVSVAVRKTLTALGVDRAFASAAEEFAYVRLGPKAQERVRTAYESAARAIAVAVADGATLRDDGFFDYERSDGAGTAAEEVLDHVLLRAEEAYELRKAERLGELYAFIARRSDIRPPHANRLIELVGRLTYQQLLWLGLFSAAELREHLPDWESTGAFTVDEQAFVGDVLELVELNLLHRDDNRRIVDFTRLDPRQLKTGLEGSLLVEAMSLREAEQEDWLMLNAVLFRLGRLEAHGRPHALDVVGRPGDAPGTRVRVNYQAVHFPPLAAPVESSEADGGERHARDS